TRSKRDWSSDVCSSDLEGAIPPRRQPLRHSGPSGRDHSGKQGRHVRPSPKVQTTSRAWRSSQAQMTEGEDGNATHDRRPSSRECPCPSPQSPRPRAPPRCTGFTKPPGPYLSTSPDG